jgi:hypothetical protein
MEINVEVSKLTDKVKHEVTSRAFRAANELRNAELEVLRGQRSGKVYRKPHTKHATYTASAPGEPPAVRTGDLRRQWRTTTGSEGTGNNFTVKPAITSNTKYAPILEEGSGNIAPRPFKEEIQKKAMPAIQKIYSEPYL